MKFRREFHFNKRKNAKFDPMKIRNITRRQILQGLAISGISTPFNVPLFAAGSGSPEVHELTDRISLITGAGANVVLYRGNQSYTAIDSGSLDHSAVLRVAVEDLVSGRPITTLFNTHWHEDHTGGNEAFRAMGAKIFAHENTRLWLTADFDIEWRNTAIKPRPIKALPDETFYFSGEKDLGGETVQYHHHVQAHTDGDIALFFPDSNVLVAGGLLSVGSYPVPDIATGGWIGGLIPANAAMLELANEDTIIIPDEGPAVGKAALQAQHDMLADLYEQMKELARMGYHAGDMLEAKVTSAYDARWGDPSEFIHETYRGMWAHSRDMGGFI